LQLPASDVCVLELEVMVNSAVTQASLLDAKLPEGVLVAAVLQEDYVRVPAAGDCLQAGNTALVLAREGHIAAVKAAFSSVSRPAA
ncbi:MAG: hypothetical protein KDA51_10410, partial [Planctomycetales bacterium]|nr:hypothetical protein [Planctomycetales bacterium]